MPSSELKPGDLAKLASDVLIGNGVPCPWYLAGKIADAAFARWPHIAGPQRIDHDEELLRLPSGSLVVDRKERVWRTYYDGDHDCLDVVGIPASIPLPAYVVHRPVPSDPDTTRRTR